MKLLFSILGFLLLAAWFIERWIHQRDRERSRREAGFRHITGSARRWWKEPADGDEDLGDH